MAVGHKRDSWFAIDHLTGTKIQTLSVDSAPEVCPSSGINQVFIGRTGNTCLSSFSLLILCFIAAKLWLAKLVRNGFDDHIPCLR